MSLRDVVEIAAAIIVSVGGAGVIIIGLASWLGRVWAARILENDRAAHARELEHMRGELSRELARVNAELDRSNRRVQAELDKTIFVHRVQFETEFQALSRIWESVARLRAAFSALRPTMHTVSPSDDPQAALLLRFREFNDSLSSVLAAVDHHSPFYSAEIFSKLNELIGHAQLEDLQVRTRRPETDPNWYEQGAKNLAAFMGAANQVSDAIRNRISRMALIEDRAGGA